MGPLPCKILQCWQAGTTVASLAEYLLAFIQLLHTVLSERSLVIISGPSELPNNNIIVVSWHHPHIITASLHAPATPAPLRCGSMLLSHTALIKRSYPD